MFVFLLLFEAVSVIVVVFTSTQALVSALVLVSFKMLGPLASDAEPVPEICFVSLFARPGVF